MLNKMKSSILYSRVEVAAANAKIKVKEVAKGDVVKKTAQAVCTASSVNSAVKAAGCATAAVTGSVAAPGAAAAAAVYYAGKAVVHGSLSSMLSNKR